MLLLPAAISSGVFSHGLVHRTQVVPMLCQPVAEYTVMEESANSEGESPKAKGKRKRTVSGKPPVPEEGGARGAEAPARAWEARLVPRRVNFCELSLLCNTFVCVFCVFVHVRACYL